MPQDVTRLVVQFLQTPPCKRQWLMRATRQHAGTRATDIQNKGHTCLFSAAKLQTPAQSRIFF